MLNLKITSLHGTLFEGEVSTAVFPGEAGYFEILPFHKPLFSRLKTGLITIDKKKTLQIYRGIVRVHTEGATALVETQGGS